ncbi:outer membrane beta-barrel domain-containing protein [Marinibactrum halimedae]|uniref:Outer membrane protein beta-barrel domain-containing protein n=1 Tax=Marinibactrum halimedae TaxID=1444977 RepID=A0AA37T4B8_9GAMM|nr:outer membrane beta-barrel domain-containing protein [Marinibactrum halimedae]MCD9457426.1 outer membrane beta-barrel domain-containing protein [Marinibactrum halimedae]GLS25524.1 hypothetical protein GCM10007877_12380 [Marinibactrum halimedae]
MEFRLQRFLLSALLTLGIAGSQVCFGQSADEKPSNLKDVDTEYFDIGLFYGSMNVEDFTSASVIGINATFNAGENYFLQMNYLQSDVDLSSFEESQGQIFSGSDRTLQHYDVVLGYNLFQGEHFIYEGKALLSSLYVVGGIGDTEFGGESNFTYVAGVGYQVAFTRDIIGRIDYRDYIFKTNAIGDDEFTHNTQFSVGLSYLF